MKRLAAVALVVGSLAGVCLSMQAQRGSHSGGISSGGMRGAAPSRAGFSAAPRGYSAGPRSYSGRIASPPGAYRGGSAGYGATTARPAFYSNHMRAYGRLRGGGYGYGYPLAGGFVAPYYLGYPDTIGYDAPAAPYGDAQNYVEQPGGPPPDPNAGMPDPSQQQPAQMAYAPPPAAAAPPEPEDAVTIIYKDGRSEQIHNYALTRTTLYVTDRRRRDIPLDQIDVPATEKVNHDAGVDFQLPEAH